MVALKWPLPFPDEQNYDLVKKQHLLVCSSEPTQMERDPTQCHPCMPSELKCTSFQSFLISLCCILHLILFCLCALTNNFWRKLGQTSHATCKWSICMWCMHFQELSAESLEHFPEMIGVLCVIQTLCSCGCVCECE